MITRNHTGHRCGQSHPKAALTDKQVKEMRFLRDYNPTHWTYSRLAEHFGCGESTVRDIITWRTRFSA